MFSLNYDLPKEKIAQRPIQPYDAAKLLVVNAATGGLLDSTFTKLPGFTKPGDIFVFNNSMVMPYRIYGSINEKQIELLLLRKMSSDFWLVIGKPMKLLRPNTKINIGEEISGIVYEKREDGIILQVGADLHAYALNKGAMPIPPYIRGGAGDEQDKTEYQSIFASVAGSIAAPTASLHFTPSLIERLIARGCSIRFITLHLGTASFAPISYNGKVRPPQKEQFRYDKELIIELNKEKERGNRIIAVGTTVVRALESMAARDLSDSSDESSTDLFIQSGYQFKLVDLLITNFHQPNTSHLCLVEAFLGRALLEKGYNHALNNDYRFLSYGDGMMILYD